MNRTFKVAKSLTRGVVVTSEKASSYQGKAVKTVIVAAVASLVAGTAMAVENTVTNLTLNGTTLTITGVDLLAYADSLIARFSNPALKHRTWQIAMDGSQKLPQRMLDGIRVHLARDSRWPLLALGVAGWMRYVSGTDDAGQTIDVRDPLVDKIRQRVAQSDEQQRVDALLGLEEIFGRDLPHNAQFVAGIRAAWQQLATHGAREAVARALNS